MDIDIDYANAHANMWSICGVLDPDTGEVRSVASVWKPEELPPCDYHETLKRNKFDDPMRFRYGVNGFFTTIPNARPFTAQELDLIVDHVLSKYRGLKHAYDGDFRTWRQKSATP